MIKKMGVLARLRLAAGKYAPWRVVFRDGRWYASCLGQGAFEVDGRSVVGLVRSGRIKVTRGSARLTKKGAHG